MKRILADTGALYALVDQDDGWHERVLAYLSAVHVDLIIPITVMPEVCYLIDAHLGPMLELQFVQSIQRGDAQIEHLKTEDLSRIVAVMDKYSSSRLGFVDASVVAVAERLRIRELLTTDRRHFSLVRPRHCPGFDLNP